MPYNDHRRYRKFGYYVREKHPNPDIHHYFPEAGFQYRHQARRYAKFVCENMTQKKAFEIVDANWNLVATIEPTNPDQEYVEQLETLLAGG